MVKVQEVAAPLKAVLAAEGPADKATADMILLLITTIGGENSSATASFLQSLYYQMTNFAESQVKLEAAQLEGLKGMLKQLDAQGSRGCVGWWCGGSSGVAVTHGQQEFEALKTFKFKLDQTSSEKPDRNVRSLFDQMDKFSDLQVKLQKQRHDSFNSLEVEVNRHSKRGGTGWCFGMSSGVKASQPLPEGWASKRDRNDKTYYYNQATNVVQYEHPSIIKVPKFEYVAAVSHDQTNPMHSGSTQVTGAAGSGARLSMSGGPRKSLNAENFSRGIRPTLSAMRKFLPMNSMDRAWSAVRLKPSAYGLFSA
jgi:hypothetical protein